MVTAVGCSPTFSRFNSWRALLRGMEHELQERIEENAVIEISREEVYSILADLQSLREMVIKT